MYKANIYVGFSAAFADAQAHKALCRQVLRFTQAISSDFIRRDKLLNYIYQWEWYIFLHFGVQADRT